MDLRKVAFENIVESSVSAVAFLAQHKQIEFEENIPNNIMVLCDEDRTIQCVVNLLSNAIKFSPKGSKVQVNVSSTEGWYRLEVIDQGPGVPDSEQGNLFNKFVQLKQPESTKKEGSGLGLYICRLLIEAQGGRLGYRSPEEKGSCFYLELSSS